MLLQDDIVPRRLRLLGWTLAGLGIILRLRQYFAGRPLWLDEAMVALNVLLRSYGGLLRPLDSDQTAPFPFLWGVKLSSVLWGTDERVLRLLPILGGVGLLLLMVPLARRLLEPRAAALAVGLTALSPLAIYYSNEIKPYGLDATFMALLAWLTLRVLDRPESRTAWGALCAAAILASAAVSPVPFCLSGVMAALLWDRTTRTATPFRRWFPVMLVSTGVVFLVLYVRLYRPVADNPFMQRFWLSFFLDPTLPGFGTTLYTAFGTGLRDLFMAEGGSWRVTAALVFLLPLGLGANALRMRHGMPVMLLCALPWLAALAASALRRYPFAPRLMMFSAPLVIIMVAAGVAAVSHWLQARFQRVPWFYAACAGLVILPGLDAVRQFHTPLQREAVGLLIPWVEQAHLPGATIYIPGRTMAAWLFYSTDWNAPDTARALRLSRLTSSDGAAFYLAPARRDSITAEGDAFRFGYRDWIELVGISPGHGPDATGQKQPLPDPGWYHNEVRRMLAARGPELWLVSATYHAGYLDPLTAPLEAAGAKVLERRITPGGNVTRYQFPDSAEMATAGP